MAKKRKQVEKKKVKNEEDKIIKPAEAIEATNNEKNIQNRQIKYIITFMIVLILVIIAVVWIINGMKKFEYGGLKFEKIMYDKLPLYYGRIPITDVNKEVVNYYNMYLRNDPRELRNIPIEGVIRLMKNAVISIDSSIEGCEDNGIAGMSLGTFLRAAGIKTYPGTTNLTVAKESNITYATCNQSENASVIIIKQGTENKITQEGTNCYSINFADCEINKAVERFMVATVAHSKGIEV